MMQYSEAIGPTFDVGVFQGSAVTAGRHPLGFEDGERHDIIVFMRQPHGNEADPVAMEQLMRQAGWRKSFLSLVFVLNDRSKVLSGDTILNGSYKAALEHGGSIIVCNEAD